MKAMCPLGSWTAPRPHGQTPAMARMMVLLPLPDWPRISTRSPGWISTSASATSISPSGRDRPSSRSTRRSESPGVHLDLLAVAASRSLSSRSCKRHVQVHDAIGRGAPFGEAAGSCRSATTAPIARWRRPAPSASARRAADRRRGSAAAPRSAARWARDRRASWSAAQGCPARASGRARPSAGRTAAAQPHPARRPRRASGRCPRRSRGRGSGPSGSRPRGPGGRCRHAIRPRPSA